jgi:hypothetical protein
MISEFVSIMLPPAKNEIITQHQALSLATQAIFPPPLSRQRQNRRYVFFPPP